MIAQGDPVNWKGLVRETYRDYHEDHVGHRKTKYYDAVKPYTVCKREVVISEQIKGSGVYLGWTIKFDGKVRRWRDNREDGWKSNFVQTSHRKIHVVAKDPNNGNLYGGVEYVAEVVPASFKLSFPVVQYDHIVEKKKKQSKWGNEIKHVRRDLQGPVTGLHLGWINAPEGDGILEHESDGWWDQGYYYWTFAASTAIHLQVVAPFSKNGQARRVIRTSEVMPYES